MPDSAADLVITGCKGLGDRELLTIDVPAVVKTMGERLPALPDRSHGKRIQDYET